MAAHCGQPLLSLLKQCNGGCRNPIPRGNLLASQGAALAGHKTMVRKKLDFVGAKLGAGCLATVDWKCVASILILLWLIDGHNGEKMGFGELRFDGFCPNQAFSLVNLLRVWENLEDEREGLIAASNDTVWRKKRANWVSPKTLIHNANPIVELASQRWEDSIA